MPWHLFEVESRKQHASSDVAFRAKTNRSFLIAALCKLATSYIVACQPSKAQWLLYVPPGLTLRNSTFCPHSVFMCFVWIWEQTAIISLYNRDGVCLLCGTDWIFIYNSRYVFCMDLRTNSDYFPIQHWMTCFYNRDWVCLLRGTDWVFKYNSGYS